MNEPQPRQVSTPVLAAIAAVLGVVAGAWWVYGNGLPPGNAEPGKSTEGLAVAKDAGGCELGSEATLALEPLARGEVAAMAIAEAPRQLPPLVFQDAEGKDIRLADLAGRSLLVNLWATWCVPCREEMPALAKLEAERGGEDFSVIAINIDTGDVAKPKAFLAEIGVSNLGLYRDATMGVFNTLKKEGLAYGLPATLLVAADGCLMGVMNGPAEWAGPEAGALIDKLVEVSVGRGIDSDGN